MSLALCEDGVHVVDIALDAEQVLDFLRSNGEFPELASDTCSWCTVQTDSLGAIMLETHY